MIEHRVYIAHWENAEIRREWHERGSRCRTGVGGVLLVVALALPAFPLIPVAAATRVVDSPSDAAADPSHCTDAIVGNCTLRDALALAVPNDTITFAQGFSGTITLSASNGPLILAQGVTITGPGQTSLFISGGCTTCAAGGTHSDGVRVFVVNSGVTATISGVTIERGRAGDGSGGGGILNHGALTVTDSTISGNATGNGGNGGNGVYGGNGGGIYTDGTLILTGSTITGNSTGYGALNSSGTGYDGGNGGGIFSNGPLTLTGSTITGNSTGRGGDGNNGTNTGGNGGSGGGIFSYGTLTVTGGTTISGNSTGSGASGYGNGGNGGNGGGLSIAGGSPVTVTGGTILATTAPAAAAALVTAMPTAAPAASAEAFTAPPSFP